MAAGSPWVLGFDPGLNFGFAAFDSDFIRAWTPRPFPELRIQLPEHVKTGVRVISARGVGYGLAMVEVEMWLNQLFDAHPCKFAASEDTQGNFQSQNALLAQVGSHTILAKVCAARGIQLVRYRPQSIKLYATGSGNADQSQCFSVATHAGYPVKAEHDATAVWAAEMLLTEHYQAAHGGRPVNFGGKKRGAKRPRTAKQQLGQQRKLAL